MSWICHRCETENKEGLLYCEVCEELSPHYSEIMREEEAWNNATQINTEDSYNSYLRIFPAGKYQIEAQHRISKLINEKELKAEFYIPTMVDTLINDGRAKVKVLDTTAKWFGVTYIEDKPNVLLQINDLISKGVYPSRLW